MLLSTALVNCCTIDWFDPWPAEALKVHTSTVTVIRMYAFVHTLNFWCLTLHSELLSAALMLVVAISAVSITSTAMHAAAVVVLLPLQLLSTNTNNTAAY
jgi:P-loop containing dynein motor region D4